MGEFLGATVFGFICAFIAGSASSYESLRDKYIRGLEEELDGIVFWSVFLWVLTLMGLIMEPSPEMFGMVFGILLNHLWLVRG